MTALVRSGKQGDLADLHSRLAELEKTSAARESEYVRVKAAHDAFKIKYRQEVGLLHEQLDELERQIAEAELGEIVKKLGEHEPRAHATSARVRPEGRPLTSDGARKLFREVAKAIHPDLAQDEEARSRRHALMVEANRAYASGDEERLRSILEGWNNSPEAVIGSDSVAERIRLERRISQLQDQIDLCLNDLAELKDTPIWKLKVMVDAATRQGKDLVRDMVRRLKRDILVARNRLDAIRSMP